MSDIKDIEKTLWAAADKLRSNMDAAEYKHVVLGLIFLKYISVTRQVCIFGCQFRMKCLERIQSGKSLHLY